MSCAKHIEANVAQKFGKQCAKFVCAIAKSFSFRSASLLFDEIRKLKPEAARYLENITESGVLCQSTQWFSDLPSPALLPPRYAIVTSNTSDSVNKQQFGRPKTKRIRRRSKFIIFEDSPVKCSSCAN